MPPKFPTVFVFCTSSFGSMTVTAPLLAAGVEFLPLFHVAYDSLTRLVPLTLEVTLSATASIVNVIVSSVVLSVSVFALVVVALALVL